MNSIKDQGHENIRTRILDAAHSRFRFYGPGKTTMSEIASDIGMSAANLYRYFKNKHELAEECAWRLLHAQQEQLRNVIQQPSITAALRLQEFMLAVLQQTYERSEKEPKFEELTEYVNSQGSNLMLRKMKMELSLINDLLSQGKASGEFFVSDTVMTAQAIYVVIVFFEAPKITVLYSKQQLEEMVQHTSELLLRGLLPR